jgi:hypothetical protein
VAFFWSSCWLFLVCFTWWLELFSTISPRNRLNRLKN